MSSRIQIPLIIISGFVLRLVALNQSLWLDEGIEWWGVTAFGLKKLLTGYMLGDFNPPGHHLLMWFWVRMFGDSEIALRMPSVLFGVGTVWMVYKISEFIFHNSNIESEKRKALSDKQKSASTELRSSNFALTTALLAATNGLLIYYSQEARMYAMATFFVTASVYVFLRLQHRYSRLLLTTYYLLLTMALYSHYLTWLMVPVFVIGGMRGMRGVREVGLRGIKYALPLLATAPLWPLLVKQLQNGIASAENSQWAMLSQTTPKNVALVFIKFVSGRVPFPDGPMLQVLVGGLVMAFWVGVAMGVVRVIREVRKRKGIEGGKTVILLWATVPLVLGTLIGLVIPVFSYFRFLFVLPAVLLLFSFGVRKWIFQGIWVVVFLSFSLLYLLSPSNHRENWRGAVALIHARSEQPMVIIHPAVRPPFDYYDRGRSKVLDSDSLHPSSLFPYLSIWYIPYAQLIFDPVDTTRIQLKNQDFSRTFERHFNGVTIEQWRKFRLPNRPKFLKL